MVLREDDIFFLPHNLHSKEIVDKLIFPAANFTDEFIKTFMYEQSIKRKKEEKNQQKKDQVV
jgi:hypothetical protein